MIILGYMYLSIALLFAFTIIKTLKDDPILGLVIAITWPLTFFTLVAIYAWEAYRTNIGNRVSAILVKYDCYSIDTAVDKLSLKELKLLLWANRIGCLGLSLKTVSSIEKRLVDMNFENTFLGE